MVPFIQWGGHHVAICWPLLDLMLLPASGTKEMEVSLICVLRHPLIIHVTMLHMYMYMYVFHTNSKLQCVGYETEQYS